MNITFGKYKTYDDWGLKLQNVKISFPEIKRKEMNVPGMDGSLDLSEILTGEVNFENRTVQYTFDISDDPVKWAYLISKIGSSIHGRKLKIVNDYDKSYYYEGRVAVDTVKSSYAQSQLVITGQVAPYKYDLYDGIEPWEWDSFSFDDGIIREYKDLVVDGSCSMVIAGRRKQTPPVITCSAPMILHYREKRIELPSGTVKLYELALGEGEHALTFEGNGTVSVSYRGGSL